MVPRWFWCTPPARKDPANPQTTADMARPPHVVAHSSHLKKEPGLKERNMRNRYPSTSQGGAVWFAVPPHSLHPRTPSASFPDSTASPVVQPGLLGQAGMQQTGLALVALAACVALPSSEGEWGCRLSKPPVERRGAASPRWSRKEWSAGGNLGQEVPSPQVGISSYLQETGTGLSCWSSRRTECHLNRDISNLSHGGWDPSTQQLWAVLPFLMIVSENPQVEVGGKLLLFSHLPFP